MEATVGGIHHELETLTSALTTGSIKDEHIITLGGAAQLGKSASGEEGTHTRSSSGFTATWTPVAREFTWRGKSDKQHLISDLLNEDNVLSVRCERTSSRLLVSLLRTHMPLFPFRPDSNIRLFFDICGLLLLFHDSLSLPIQISFQTSDRAAFTIMSFTFWFSDLILNFLTCFMLDDVEYVQLRVIAWHYIRSWFLLDAGLVAFDGFCVLMMALGWTRQANYVTLLRLLKAGRILRLTLVIRSDRNRKLLNLAREWVDSLGLGALVHLFVQMFKLSLFMLWFNHIGACFWVCLVRRWSEGMGASWSRNVVQAGLQVHGRDQIDWELYTMGYYWSVVVTFSGASPLLPLNSLEEAVSSIGVVLGTVLGSAVISYLTTILFEYSQRRAERRKSLWMLRRFLQQNSVTPVLAQHVVQQVRCRMLVEEHIAEADVTALHILSSGLRVLLQRSLHATVLVTQPLLASCDCLNMSFASDLSAKAISRSLADPGEVVFDQGVNLDKAYVVLWGKLQYTVGSVYEIPVTWTDVDDSCTNVLPAKSWLCELTLWLFWTTRGSAEASARSELLTIDAMKTLIVLQAHPETARIMQDYSVALCGWFEHEIIDPTDINPGVDHDVVTAGMPRRSRQLLSQPELKSLAQQMTYSSRKLEQLEAEIYEGSCNLRTDEFRRVLRVVQVVALRLVRVDDLICVKLAELSECSMHTKTALPGTKLRSGELPMMGLRRLLHALEFDTARIGERRVDRFEEFSVDYGVRTKYIRTEFDASWDGVGAVGTSPTVCTSFAHGLEELFHSHFDVFAVADDDHTSFYAWMHEDDFTKVAAFVKNTDIWRAWATVVSGLSTTAAAVEEFVAVATTTTAAAVAASNSGHQ